MLHLLQNPILLSLFIGLFVAIYMWFEDSFSDSGIKSMPKYVRAFILTAVAINVTMTYSKKSMHTVSNNIFQQSYNVGHAPF